MRFLVLYIGSASDWSGVTLRRPHRSERQRMAEPDWLVWARQLQAVAQSGLTFTQDPYDRERYEAMRRLAAQIMVAHSGAELTHVEGLFAEQSGYATPKVDVRGAVFRDDGSLLMVREATDGRWSLPGGWADVNQSPREAILREVLEESGFEVGIQKLAAVFDRSRHPAFSAASVPCLQAVLRLHDPWRRAANQPRNHRNRLLYRGEPPRRHFDRPRRALSDRPHFRALPRPRTADRIRLTALHSG